MTYRFRILRQLFAVGLPLIYFSFSAPTVVLATKPMTHRNALFFYEKTTTKSSIATHYDGIAVVEQWLRDRYEEGGLPMLSPIDTLRFRATAGLFYQAWGLTKDRGLLTGHFFRVAEFAKAMAPYLDIDPRLAWWGGLVHDWGKVNFTPDILNNTNPKLTPAQWEKVKSHPLDGVELYDQYWPWRDPWNPKMRYMIRDHHVRTRAYPEYVRAEDVSSEAMLIGAADGFSAGCEHRGYDPMHRVSDVLKDFDHLLATGAYPLEHIEALRQVDHVAILQHVSLAHASLSEQLGRLSAAAPRTYVRPDAYRPASSHSRGSLFWGSPRQSAQP